MKYVIMVKDELGDDFRAYGTPFLEAEHEFPSFEDDNEAMRDAFFAWMNNIEARAQKEWEQTFGPECHVFLERKFSDYSLAEIGINCYV